MSREFFLSVRQRARLAAALAVLGATFPAVCSRAAASGDLAALRAQAETGNPDALNALADAFAGGVGVAQNFPEAIRLYELAAAKGHAPAFFNLGLMSELGRGLPADPVAAFNRYRRAAELGYAPAQFNVGNMYANGLGVKQDFAEAVVWFRPAADRAVPEAQYNLALAYELGRGVAKDEGAAQKWYRAAAAQNYARARYNLALMLEDGRGSAPDQAAAAGLYRAAAAQNFGPAQNNYGMMLAEGRGAPKADAVEAYAWLSLAVENGSKPTAREQLGRRLAPDQLADAVSRAEVLRAQFRPATVPGAASGVVAVLVSPASRPRPSETPAPAAGPVDTAPPVAADPAVSALRSQIYQLERDAVAVRAENAAALREVADLGAQLKTAQAADREQLNTQLDSAGKTIAELSAKNEELGKDLQVARQSAAAALAAQAAAAKAAPDGLAMRLEMQTLQDQVTKLENSMETERGAAAREITSLAGQLQATRETNRALGEANRALIGAKPSDDPALRAQRDQFEAKARELTAALAALQAKFGESEKAVDEHNASVAELTGLNERLAREKTALSTRSATAETAAERARAELAEVQSRLETEAKASARQAATLAAMTAGEEKSAAKFADLNAQLATLRGENARLAQAGEDLAKLRAEAAELRRKSAESDRAGDRHAATVAELTGANEKLEAARRDAEQRADRWVAAAEQLGAAQRELAGLRSEHARLRESAAANERERGARLAQLQQENAAVSARLRQAQGTLDQIASAARFINGTVGGAQPAAAAPVRPSGAGVATPAAAPAERSHTVQEGDSLTRISSRYFGTPNRWQDVYEANRDVLRGENSLRPGQRLRIP